MQARHARRHGRDPSQLETRQGAAVRHQFALALHHVQIETGLVVGVSGEGLYRAARDGGVAMDQLLRHPAHHLQAQRERHHIHQNHILARVARQQVGLHSRAQGDHLVGIDVSQGFAPEERDDHSPHDGHAGGATHQDHARKLLRFQAGVAQRPAHRGLAPIQDRPHHGVQLLAREHPTPDVARPALDDNFDRGELGQCLFRIPRRIQHAAGQGAVAGRILGQAHLPQHMRRKGAIKVVAAQGRVATRGLDLEHASFQLQDRYVERAAPEVEHGKGSLGLLVQAIGQGRGCGLVEQPHDIEPRQATRVARGLSLPVVEVGRHGDHRAVQLTTQRGLGTRLENAQDLG